MKRKTQERLILRGIWGFATETRLGKRRVNVCAQMQVTQSFDIKQTDDWSDLTKQMHEYHASHASTLSTCLSLTSRAFRDVGIAAACAAGLLP